MNSKRKLPLFSLLSLALSLMTFTTGCQRQVLQPETAVPSKERKMLSGRLVPARDSLDIWFVRPQNETLSYVAVKRPYKGQNTVADYLDYAVKELARGPSGGERDQGLGSELPAGTVLIDVKNKPGKDVTVNLSRLFVQGGGIDSFETRMEQLRRTVSPLAYGSKIYLEVEGERLTQTVGEGLEIKQPINTN